MNTFPSIEELKNGILSKDRMALAKAISLVENSMPEAKKKAQGLVEALMPYTGKAQRIGITGTPGAGKSSLIESLGLAYIQNQKTVAVLAVDPSSQKTKGSILGDKTRMERLSKNDQAFIRPSPSKGYYGGIALATYEAMLLCEAFGFDVILIETVGVGQSETMVADIVDMFLLVAVSGGGDELQGIKRGIMEMADLIFINKVDAEPAQKDIYFYTDLKRAIPLFRSDEKQWTPPVIMGSATTENHLEDLVNDIQKYFTHIEKNGFKSQNRKNQNIKRFRHLLEQRLIDRFWTHANEYPLVEKLLTDVKNGEVFAPQAVDEILQNIG